MSSKTETLDLELVRNAAVNKQFFPYIIVPNFIHNEKLAGIHQDYPEVPGPGSYPVDLLKFGKNFQDLLNELEGSEFRAVIAEKFEMPLEGRPTLVTVRGHSDKNRDGRIHSDTKTKLISLLLYLNPSWESDSGRLRLLRNSKDIEDMIDEVPPLEGTLLAFKVTDNSWHGHKPFHGPRRVVQLNYVINKEVVEKELSRHRFSAKVKKFKSMIGL